MTTAMDFHKGMLVHVEHGEDTYVGEVALIHGVDPAMVDLNLEYDGDNEQGPTWKGDILDLPIGELRIVQEFKSVTKCPGCEEVMWFDEGNETYMVVSWRGPDLEHDQESTIATFGEHKDAVICGSCRESDLGDSASTIMLFQADGEREVVRFGDFLAEVREPEYAMGEEAPSWFDDMIKKRNYVRTDGWRGYFDTTPEGEFKKITSGWVTGYPDDTVAYKMDAAELFEKLRDGDVEPPVEIYWLFEPTSNVFSTASEIFVKTADYDKAAEWLTSINFPVEKLERAFG
jgi:hypothetical protein